MTVEPEFVTAAREYQRRYYQERREAKLAYARQQRIDHGDRIRARRRELRIEKGLQVRGEPVVPGGFVNSKHYNRQHYLLRQCESNFRDKIAALQAVSKSKNPTCSRCGCSDVRVLVINHLNGDGNKDRLTTKGVKRLRKSILSGSRALNDLDVRCASCNALYEYERGRIRLPSNWQEILAELTDGRSL
jgi:hypothetical protein